MRMSAIGDTVHAMPVVASLRRAWPGTEIVWVLQPGPHALLAGHPDVSEFLLFHREKGARAFVDFRRRVRGRRFDVVLDCHRYLKAGLVTAILDAPVKVGFDRARARDLNWLFTTHRIPAREPRHVQEQYFEFLEYLEVPVVPVWDFHFSPEERAARDAFFRRIEGSVLAVVLRSSRPEKDWTLDRFARVLEIAEFDLGLRPVLVGGGAPRERAAAARVGELTRARPVDALAHDLRRLAWLLDGSSVVLSPDSGPLHIAVALGTPTVGLYGSTDPKRSGPYGRFGDLVVDRYTRPGETVASEEDRPGNMARITVREVAEKLELAVGRYVRPPAPAPADQERGVPE